MIFEQDAALACFFTSCIWAETAKKVPKYCRIFLTKKRCFKSVKQHSDICELRWGRSSVWLERLPVTQKAASSSLVAPAIKLGRHKASFFSFIALSQ